MNSWVLIGIPVMACGFALRPDPSVVVLGSILPMKGFMEQQRIISSPFDLSLWATPAAIAAFPIDAARLGLCERRRRR